MSRIDASGVPLPDRTSGTLVARAGAPSAVLHGGVVHLAYRRDDAVVVARSDDGVRVETVAVVTADRLGAGSLGRPALVVTPPGRWRLYVSCAEHRRVDLLEADSPSGLADAPPVTVLTGATDPVVQSHGGSWHLWAAVHPDAGYATSPDGVTWTWQGTALVGGRISSVVDLGDRLVATFDGRGEDGAGIAVASSEGFGRFQVTGEAPAAGVRHLDVLPLPGGDYRLYYEVTGPDGVPELWTERAVVARS